MSDTPRTDAQDGHPAIWHGETSDEKFEILYDAMTNHARALERELAEERQRTAFLELNSTKASIKLIDAGITAFGTNEEAIGLLAGKRDEIAAYAVALNKLAMKFAAELVQMAPGYEAGETEFLNRNAVMEKVTAWRREWDKLQPEAVPVGVALGPRVIAPDAKIDLENATDADWADLTACLEREHVKKVIRETYALFDRFKAPFKQGAESAMDELSFRLLESWGEKNPHALADENNERPEPVQGEGVRVPQDTFNHLSRLHGEARELARSYRDTACRTLDKAEIFARQGKPLPADEIAAMTARIVRDDKKLDGEGRKVPPHRTGPTLGAYSEPPATEHAPEVKS